MRTSIETLEAIVSDLSNGVPNFPCFHSFKMNFSSLNINQTALAASVIDGSYKWTRNKQQSPEAKKLGIPGYGKLVLLPLLTRAIRIRPGAVYKHI